MVHRQGWSFGELAAGMLASAMVASLATLQISHMLHSACIPPWEAPQGAHLPGLQAPAQASSRFLTSPHPVPGPIAWEHLSPQTRAEYTLDGRVPVKPWFKNSTGEAAQVVAEWSVSAIDARVAVADRRNHSLPLCSYGVACNVAVFEALQAHPVEGKSVLVVGSQKPWLEAICISFGARAVTTVDFIKPATQHPLIRTMSVQELEASGESFDAVLSYSSLEHDGLGRYGDPIDPDADIERVKKLQGLLHREGKLYLSVPTGPDFLYYNAHRVYGPIRFPMLVEGWAYLATYGENSLDELFRANFLYPEGCNHHLGCWSQPLHVLSLSRDTV